MQKLAFSSALSKSFECYFRIILIEFENYFLDLFWKSLTIFSWQLSIQQQEILILIKWRSNQIFAVGSYILQCQNQVNDNSDN
jgi:hypothetical protein